MGLPPSLNQSINQMSIAPISPAKPGSAAPQPNRFSMVTSLLYNQSFEIRSIDFTWRSFIVHVTGIIDILEVKPTPSVILIGEIDIDGSEGTNVLEALWLPAKWAWHLQSHSRRQIYVISPLVCYASMQHGTQHTLCWMTDSTYCCTSRT